MKDRGNQLKGITYEIFVQSFCDSNGDGIGDLNGVTTKLDYLSELSIEAIWLMPIHPSPSYHKYDITNYYDVHPDYGTLEDFKTLVSESHKRGIRVIIDLVINHCSKLHPWFINALNPKSKYRDYFIWSTKEDIEKKGSMTKEASGDSDNKIQWNSVHGQDEMYYSFFYSGMPDLNFDNPKVREEMYTIGEFWLGIGVDGFRLDAAKHIFPEERAKDTHAFWEEFKNKMKRIKKDVHLVGEVWADLQEQIPFAKGFDELFNFNLALSILETVKRGKLVSASIHKDSWETHSHSSPIQVYLKSDKAFQQINPDFNIATFLTNHDQNRTMSFLNNHLLKTKLTASILLTLPGSPYIYYGEELGMRGSKPDEFIREPFLWSAGATQTKWLQPKYSTPEFVEPAEKQMNETNSLFHHYKQLILLRKENTALTAGFLEELSNDQIPTILSYRRYDDSDSLVVIHNLSGRKQTISNLNDLSNVHWSSRKNTKFVNNTLTLPPYGSAILNR